MLEKVQQEYLKGLYAALSRDCAVAIPDLHVKGLERDVSRLLSCVEKRGFRVLTQDLPDLGKHFDLCLANQRLSTFNGVLSSTIGAGSPVPKLFQGLVLRVFDEHGMLRSTPCTESIRFFRQFCYLAKKWKMKCDDSFTFNEVREFYRVDQQLRSPTLNWSGDELCRGDFSAHNNSFVDGAYLATTRDQIDLFSENNADRPAVDVGALLAYLQRVSDIMSATLGVFEAEHWQPQHGPGVVSDLKRDRSKYDFPVWPERLEQVFPLSIFAYANEGIWADQIANGEGEGRFAPHLHYSRLIAVPKTQKGPRLIAAEPSCNQWCQQAIRKYLVARTESSWMRNMISFGDQTPNQQLALAASLTGDKATIDLKSASDRMSCHVVERFFRGRYDLLRAFHASRTTIIRNLIDKKSPEFYELRKFSTMGSAVTFPVQSLVFAGIALACVAFAANERNINRIKGLAHKVRVFGDDIIVPTDVLGLVRYLLELLGFEVNTTKTFGTGKFRESCGVDAYDGVNVTPVYALLVPTKSKPESLVSYAAQAHNFALRGMWSVAEYYQWSAKELGLGKDLPLVTAGSDILGWPNMMGEDYSHLKTRWNSSLHRAECLTRILRSRRHRVADRGDRKSVV